MCAGKGFGEKAPPKPGPQKVKPTRLGDQPSQAQQKMSQEALASIERSTAQAQQQMSSQNDDDDVVSTAVTDRMLSRVLTFAGIPVFFGLLLYPMFWYLKVVKDIDLPMGTVFIVQSIVFGVGLLGITYGVTSASWDPARTGSAFGWNEFRANLAAIMGKVGKD